MSRAARILLADDQPVLCSALRLLLEQEPGLDIVGEASDAHSLLLSIISIQPDLVLLDWELPGIAAATLLYLLHTQLPQLQVIALSSRPEAHQAALDAGVAAFVSKGDPPERLLHTIEEVRRRVF